MNFTDKELYVIAKNELEILQKEEEILWAMDRIRSHIKKPLKIVLELGSYKGGNLIMMSRMMENNGILISIDPEICGESVNVDLVKKYIGNIDFNFIKGYSIDVNIYNSVKEIIKEEKIDLVIYDSEHMERTLKPEFEKYSIMTNSPGVSFFHEPAFGIKGCHRNNGPTSMDYINSIKYDFSYEEKRCKEELDFYGICLLLH